MEIIDGNRNNGASMSVSDWVLTIFLSGLPVIGLILLFIWAFGDNQRPERVNWAKATLIWMLFGIALATVFFMVFGAAFLAGMAGME